MQELHGSLNAFEEPGDWTAQCQPSQSLPIPHLLATMAVTVTRPVSEPLRIGMQPNSGVDEICTV